MGWQYLADRRTVFLLPFLYFCMVINLRKHIGIALFYFLLVSLMGILMRFYFVAPLPINYKFLLHAHSHTALLGWIYLGLITLIYKVFLEKAEKPKLYRRIFIFTNITIVGMLLTFPFQRSEERRVGKECTYWWTQYHS